MGTEELQVIAEILSSMGDVSITGLIWFFGFGIAKVVIWAAVILIVAWLVYKLISSLFKWNDWLKTLSALVGQRVHGEFVGSDYNSMQSAIMNLKSERDKLSASFDEQKHSLKDYMGRLGSLSKDYETVWEENEKLKEQLETAQKHCITLEQEITAMRRANDPSINSDFDKPMKQEDTDGHEESVQDVAPE